MQPALHESWAIFIYDLYTCVRLIWYGVLDALFYIIPDPFVSCVTVWGEGGSTVLPQEEMRYIPANVTQCFPPFRGVCCGQSAVEQAGQMTERRLRWHRAGGAGGKMRSSPPVSREMPADTRAAPPAGAYIPYISSISRLRTKHKYTLYSPRRKDRWKARECKSVVRSLPLPFGRCPGHTFLFSHFQTRFLRV